MLKEACAEKSIQGCVYLARVANQGLRISTFSFDPNQEEAKKVGMRWQELALTDKGMNWQRNLFELRTYGTWGHLDPIDLVSYFILTDRSIGWKDIPGGMYTTFKLTKEQYETALERAHALEKLYGLAEEKTPPTVEMANRVSKFFTRREELRDGDMRLAARAFAAAVIVSNRQSVRLQ